MLIGVSFFYFQKVKFNGDIASINYVNPRYQEAQQQLEQLTDSQYKSVYAAAYGNSLEEALTRNYHLYQQLQHLKATDSIRQFSSVAALILPQTEQQERIKRWQTFWSEARKEALRTQLQQLGAQYGF